MGDSSLIFSIEIPAKFPSLVFEKTPRRWYSFFMKQLTLPLLFVSFLFVACVPNTPERRIAKNSVAFQALTPKQQEHVRQGEVSRGMPPEAVMMAWGAPSRRYSGSKDGVHTQRWDYMGTQAVFTNQVGWGPGFGPGWGRGWGWGGAWGPWGDPFFGPDVAYIPYRRATIVFKNQKVDSWEKLQDSPP